MKPTLWVIDDDPALRLILEDNFTDSNINVVSFANAHAAWIKLNDFKSKIKKSSQPRDSSFIHNNKLSDDLPDAIITDIRMPMMDGLSFSEWLSKEFPHIPVIIITAHSDLQSAIDSYQTGAFEYLPKPFDLDDAINLVEKAFKRNEIYMDKLAKTSTQRNTDQKNIDKEKPVTTNQTPSTSQVDDSLESDKTSRKTVKDSTRKNSKDTSKNKTKHVNSSSSMTYGIIGQSTAMQTVFKAIGKLANAPITVLITGESGTGKELVAKALHQSSPRSTKPFIALNMSAIPHDLIESELFGHDKGAFTGATSDRQGRFEQADGGTLFLDEIGDMPFNTQTRLLRVLASGEFFRVGGKDPIKVDVRIISATHQNLEHLVQQRKFREDLFYRLNVIRLPLPPLRYRKEDIPQLIKHFLARASRELNTDIKTISDDAMQLLMIYDWHGNIRQLENACRWVTVMSTGNTVFGEDLPTEILEFNHNQYHDNNISSNLGCKQNHIALKYPLTLDTANHRKKPHETDSNQPSWTELLCEEVIKDVKQGNTNILTNHLPKFERVLIDVALTHSKGHRSDTAKILGWGRNTLTKKIIQVGLDDKW